MTFVDRTFPDIVRDVLTNLTQGVSGEVHRVSYDPSARPLAVPDIVLERRPVRRVSAVSGLVRPAPGTAPVRVDFSLNDYELVGDPADPADLHTIRFLPFGRKPAPGTDVIVNYYPRTTDPTVITDANVGGVARTLLEAVAKELTLLYAQVNLAYDAGFVELASGVSLDRVVALLGYRRFTAGRPVGSVRFSRRGGVRGEVSVPAGTAVTDAADKVRYETVETRTMFADESTAEVRVRGATDTTPPVPEHTLTVVQRAIAGVDTVSNERPTATPAADESDAELRARVSVALLASNKGTVSAIEHGLSALPEVQSVSVEEFPNQVPGELRLSISLTNPGGALPAAVLAKIEELRPAGIRVLPTSAGGVGLAANVALTLAGSHLAPAALESLHREVQATLSGLVAKAGVGQRIRVGPLVAALLADQRIVDATITLGAKGQPSGAPGADFDPGAATVPRLAAADVSFAPDAFEQAVAATGPRVAVEVRAAVAASPQAGVSLDAAGAQVTTRLKSYFASLAAGAAVTSATVLAALRDDANYQLDPLRLKVTLSSDEQFVQVAEGGQAFTVKPEHSFTVADVEVTA
jgi:uncharacterized phage protein gp47/JayE